MSTMFKRFKRGQKGFTLIEILIVLAVLAVLAGVVVPNLSGILGRGEARAYEADQRAIQAAVDDHYAAVRVQGKSQYPILAYDGTNRDAGASGGTPVWDGVTSNWTAATGKFLVDFKLLVGPYLKASPKSASPETVSAENNYPVGETYSGHYAWYVDANGIVKSISSGTGSNHTTVGFVSGIYP